MSSRPHSVEALSFTQSTARPLPTDELRGRQTTSTTTTTTARAERVQSVRLQEAKPMPSPMALNPPSPTPSVFSLRKKSSQTPVSAASYLSALSQMDAMARSRGSTPSSTPALSFSSSATGSSGDTSIDDDNDDSDGLSTPMKPPTSEQVFSTVHAEFGHCADERYRYESRCKPGDSYDALEMDPPYYILLTTYLSYLLLIAIGHVRDYMGKVFRPETYKHLKSQDVSTGCW